jgi:hypothetical protein
VWRILRLPPRHSQRRYAPSINRCMVVDRPILSSSRI